MARHWYDLSVFTRDGEGGNPLAVVPDAVEVETEALQRWAAQIGYSETVYLDWAEDTPHPRLRIFTPTVELPFAGHPLVGTAWLMFNVAPMGGVPCLEPPAGVVDCGADAGSAWIECNPVQSPPWAIRELDSPAAVAGYRPGPGDEDVGVFALDPTGTLKAKVRFFAQGAGVPEDPATGSFAVVLAAALRDDGRMAEGDTLEIVQGDEVGRPSRILVTALPASRVRLHGTVTLLGVQHLS